MLIIKKKKTTLLDTTLFILQSIAA